MSEIADWQQQIAAVKIERLTQIRRQPAVGSHTLTVSRQQWPEGYSPLLDMGMSFDITNNSARDLQGVTMRIPFDVGRVSLNGIEVSANRLIYNKHFLVLSIATGQTLEVEIWPGV